MVSGCTGSEPSASYIVVPYAWWWHMQSPWAISTTAPGNTRRSIAASISVSIWWERAIYQLQIAYCKLQIETSPICNLQYAICNSTDAARRLGAQSTRGQTRYYRQPPHPGRRYAAPARMDQAGCPTSCYAYPVRFRWWPRDQCHI